MDLKKIKEQQHLFFQEQKTKSISQRKELLKKLHSEIQKKETAIFDALHKDLRKSPFESWTSEVMMVLKEIKTTTRHLKHWASTKRMSGSLLNFPSKDYIVNEPYGNTLIIGPWNYPFQLMMIPLIGAVAAGNTAVMKPSEHAPETSKILVTIIQNVFPSEWVSVAEGDVTVATTLLKMRWDYIFYTGSTQVGRIVAQEAAKHLTPTTLELGGKSPCIVEASAPIQKTARRIVWGKFLNCGQTCIAPDYVLVHQEIKEALGNALIKEIKQAFGEKPQMSEDFGRIINKNHFERLLKTIKKQDILYGGESDSKDCYISPTLVNEPDLKSSLMQEEIFGPILPIISYDKEETIDSIIQDLDKPLAFYVFTRKKSFADRLISKFSFGGGVVNDTVIHFANNNLPFGGVGNSGMGSYHGKQSFDTFSHRKPVVKRPFWIDPSLRYPPYPKTFGGLKKIIDLL